MKLGDLVWRSALRNRAARGIEVPRIQVIELAEPLTIPAGTDWSAEGHVIGTTTTFGRGTLVNYVLTVGVDQGTPPDVDAPLSFGFQSIDDRPLSYDSNYIEATVAPGGGFGAQNNGTFVNSFLEQFDNEDVRTFDVGFWTNSAAGPLPIDITVLYARAAFLAF